MDTIAHGDESATHIARVATGRPAEPAQPGVPGGRPPEPAQPGVPGGRPPEPAQPGVPGGRPPEPAQSGVGVLDRSVSLLELLADGPRSLRWLSDHSGLPRPTAHRLLVALEAHGLVGRDGTGAFRLGPRLAELAFRANPTLDLATLADPVLARLHDATGESVQLYVRSGDKRLCIAARDSGTGLRDSVPVGALLPLAAGSGGKVLLAWAADADRFDAVPASELATIRERGWAATVAEREQGLASVSAPVLRPDGTVTAAVCVSGPVTRLGQAPGRRLSAAVTGAAGELAAELAAGTR